MSFEADNGLDPTPEQLTAPTGAMRSAVIRTSDRIQFKGCRRRWNWQSHLRKNLGSRDTYGALWFGSGIHYALEDYHGPNKFGHPAQAFKAYVLATAANSKQQVLPPDVHDLLPLGDGMMKYYADYWLRNRNPLKTFYHQGIPQTEVNAMVEIDLNQFPRWLRQHYDHVYYSATFDRVIEDEDGFLWIVDYKTAKIIQRAHYQTDPQVGAYTWLGQHLYGRPIRGLIYMQLRKTLADVPRILANGSVSFNKQMSTSHALYRDTLVKIYGTNIERWPANNLNMLNWLATEETPEADHFIVRDRIEKNQHSFESEGTKILMEIEDMLDPTLPLYPNPTRWCSWCPFLNACISVDDGSDWEHELNMQFKAKPESYDTWRTHLPAPTHPQLTQQLEPNLAS